MDTCRFESCRQRQIYSESCVQTFLPVPSFSESAQMLDYKRLGKQRVETLQLLNALTGKSVGWANHPAAKMWRGHERALAWYGTAMCEEWIRRGYKDTCMEKCMNYFESLPGCFLPSWFGNYDFHASHRSNLLRKNREYYIKFGWTEPDNLPYVWPK